jgi:hypothetical protein
MLKGNVKNVERRWLIFLMSRVGYGLKTLHLTLSGVRTFPWGFNGEEKEGGYE